MSILPLMEVLNSADQETLDILTEFENSCPVPLAEDVREWSRRHPKQADVILSVSLGLFFAAPYLIASGSLPPDEAERAVEKLTAAHQKVAARRARARREFKLGR